MGKVVVIVSSFVTWLVSFSIELRTFLNPFENCIIEACHVPLTYINETYCNKRHV